MSKKEKKFLDTEIKDVNEKDRTIAFTASTETRDRDGDIMVASGWKLSNFMKNPVFLWAHNYSKPPIGKAVETSKEDGKLSINVQFVPAHIDPFAEQIRQLYKEKFMRTVSVGFIPYKLEELTEDDRKQRPEMSYGYRKHAELLEVSAVPVPSNPMALSRAEFTGALAKGLMIDDHVTHGLHEQLRVMKDGALDERYIRASMAMVLGARGCEFIPEALKMEQFKQLQSYAMLAGIQTDFTPLLTVKPEELRKHFEDVWGEELLELIGHEEPAPEAPVVVDPLKKEVSADALRSVESIITNLSAVKDRLKSGGAQ